MSFLQFAVSAAVVVIAGTYLSKYGNAIDAATRLSSLWIGVVLLAAATSLPEVLANISAVIVGAPDLAVGDIFGAGMANMLLLAVISLSYQRIYRKPSLLREVTLTHAITASLAMLLTALAGLFVLIRLNIGLFNVGIDSLLLLLIYLTAVWTLSGHEGEEGQKPAGVEQPTVSGAMAGKVSLRTAIIGFSLATLAILVAAPVLVSSARSIAAQTGIGTTFMGTLFLAVVTTAPELAVSISAIKIGAVDLAVGDLFGSNAFNIAVLFIADLFFRRGLLLSAVSPTHAATALVLLVLMSIGVMGLVFRAEKRYFLLVPDAVLIIGAYVIGMTILFSLSVPD